MFTQIDSLKARLDSLRPLPESVVQNLREDLTLRWTYHSNAIEGNTLTLLETKVVLEGIIEELEKAFDPYFHALGQ